MKNSGGTIDDSPPLEKTSVQEEDLNSDVFQTDLGSPVLEKSEDPIFDKLGNAIKNNNPDKIIDYIYRILGSNQSSASLEAVLSWTLFVILKKSQKHMKLKLLTKYIKTGDREMLELSHQEKDLISHGASLRKYRVIKEAILSTFEQQPSLKQKSILPTNTYQSIFYFLSRKGNSLDSVQASSSPRNANLFRLSKLDLCCHFCLLVREVIDFPGLVCSSLYIQPLSGCKALICQNCTSNMKIDHHYHYLDLLFKCPCCSQNNPPATFCRCKLKMIVREKPEILLGKTVWVRTKKSRIDLEEILIQSYDEESGEYGVYFQGMAAHRKISFEREEFLFTNREDITKVKNYYYKKYVGYMPEFEKQEPFFPMLYSSLAEKDSLKFFQKEETHTFTRSGRALATLEKGDNTQKEKKKKKKLGPGRPPRYINMSESVENYTQSDMNLHLQHSEIHPIVDIVQDKVSEGEREQEGGEPQGGDPQGGDPQGGDPQGGDPQGGDPQGGDPQGGESDTVLGLLEESKEQNPPILSHHFLESVEPNILVKRREKKKWPDPTSTGVKRIKRVKKKEANFEFANRISDIELKQMILSSRRIKTREAIVQKLRVKKMEITEEIADEIKSMRFVGKEHPDSLVDLNVWIYYKLDRLWYYGNVVKYSEISKKHTIFYQNGEQETKNLSQQFFMVDKDYKQVKETEEEEEYKKTILPRKRRAMISKKEGKSRDSGYWRSGRRGNRRGFEKVKGKLVKKGEKARLAMRALRMKRKLQRGNVDATDTISDAKDVKLIPKITVKSTLSDAEDPQIKSDDSSQMQRSEPLLTPKSTTHLRKNKNTKSNEGSSSPDPLSRRNLFSDENLFKDKFGQDKKYTNVDGFMIYFCSDSENSSAVESSSVKYKKLSKSFRAEAERRNVEGIAPSGESGMRQKRKYTKYAYPGGGLRQSARAVARQKRYLLGKQSYAHPKYRDPNFVGSNLHEMKDGMQTAEHFISQRQRIHFDKMNLLEREKKQEYEGNMEEYEWSRSNSEREWVSSEGISDKCMSVSMGGMGGMGSVRSVGSEGNMNMNMNIVKIKEGKAKYGSMPERERYAPPEMIRSGSSHTLEIETEELLGMEKEHKHSLKIHIRLDELNAVPEEKGVRGRVPLERIFKINKEGDISESQWSYVSSQYSSQGGNEMDPNSQELGQDVGQPNFLQTYQQMESNLARATHDFTRSDCQISPISYATTTSHPPLASNGINVDLMFPQLCLQLKQFYLQGEQNGYKKCLCTYCQKLYAKFLIKNERNPIHYVHLHKQYFDHFLIHFPVQTFNQKIINLFPIY